MNEREWRAIVLGDKPTTVWLDNPWRTLGPTIDSRDHRDRTSAVRGIALSGLVGHD